MRSGPADMTQIDWTRAPHYDLLSTDKYFLIRTCSKGEVFLLEDLWGMKYFFAPKATVNYPHEKGPLSPALPGRTCAAPLSQRRGTLHRLQAVRGDLPGAGHHHRRRTARGRRAAPRATTST
jgi:hypothetical protein